jgi:hypothetical protein
LNIQIFFLILEMKEKIYNYLLEEQKKITPGQILEQFFYTSDKSNPQAEKIVYSILSGDSRFVKDDSGEWSVKKQEEKQSLNNVVFSIIDFETIPVGNNKEIPVILAIAQIQNFKTILKKIFTIDIPIKVSNEIKKKRETLISQIKVDGKFITNLNTIYESLTNSILVSSSPYKTIDRLNWFFLQNDKFDLEIEKINLKALSKKLLTDIKFKTIEDIASSLKISYNSPLNCSLRIDLAIDILIDLLKKVKEKSITSINDLLGLLDDSVEWIDFSKLNFDKQLIRNLPESPGVYLMRNRENKIFYVGKSRNLKSRVASYFVNRNDLDEKGKEILNNIYDLNFEVVASELEALLLENKYINQYRPDLNTQLKIHEKKEIKHVKNRIISFLPSQMFSTINLFFLNETKSVIKYCFNLENPDFLELENTVRNFFFNNIKCENHFSEEQIEIMWRWIRLNENQINFFRLDDFGTLEKCIEITKRYIEDEKLFLEKIHHC